MTSKQVLLMAALLCASGCSLWPREAAPLPSPYAERRVFAVAPLNNESGSLQADGFVLADQIARQFENASNVDVLPVNRTIAAMEAMQMYAIAGPDDAQRLLEALNADGLIVGTVTTYDPYDPPKIGMALELYLPGGRQDSAAPDVRSLSHAATSDQAGMNPPDAPADPYKPVSVASAYFDAANSEVRRALRQYAYRRGVDVEDEGWKQYSPFEPVADQQSEHLYRINMDLFCEFVSYQMSWRLLEAEGQRVAPPAVAKNSS